MVSWGNKDAGNNLTKKLTDVAYIFSTNKAFSALKSDGSVKTWGDGKFGGDSSALMGYFSSYLEYIVSISSTNSAFTALTKDGTIFTWGNKAEGGNGSTIKAPLTGINSIYSTNSAFSALKPNGDVVTWGNKAEGGDSSTVSGNLHNVISIYSTNTAFAALKSNGDVVTWGYNINSSNSTLKNKLIDVISIYSNNAAFAALKSDGTVVTWGNKTEGGDSSKLNNTLTDVISIFSTNTAFAALKSDGTVVTWGDQHNGGDSNSVKNELNTQASYLTNNDMDNDGLSDKEEMDVCINALGSGGYQLNGGLPPCTLAGLSDSDGDGLKDGIEKQQHLDPLTQSTNAKKAIETLQQFDSSQSYLDALVKDSGDIPLYWHIPKTVTTSKKSLKLTFSDAFIKTDFNKDGIENNTLKDYFTSFDGSITFSKLNMGGSFNGTGSYEGSQFGLTSTSGPNAFVASAKNGYKLQFTFFSSPSFTLYGELDSLDLGVKLNKSNGDVWTTDSSMLIIDNLSSFINNGTNKIGRIIDRSTGKNDVHNIVYGLMLGETAELAKTLTKAGVNLDAEITRAGTMVYNVK
ncbi:heme acquisition protein HasA [Moritella viscosa]